MPNKTDNPLEQYERTYCDCNKCSLACRHMPGSLAPGDLENIAKFCGETDERGVPGSFLEEYFVASDGPIVRTLVPDPDGPPRLVDHRIPTIVPRQEGDGSCTFLDEDGKCIIHPVAPFGCRMFNVCDDPDEKGFEDSQKSAAMLRFIVQNPGYFQAWKWLKERGKVAKPLLERREDLSNALAKEK